MLTDPNLKREIQLATLYTLYAAKCQESFPFEKNGGVKFDWDAFYKEFFTIDELHLSGLIYSLMK